MVSVQWPSGSGQKGPSVVDQDVNIAKTLLGKCQQLAYFWLRADIGAAEQGAAASRLDLPNSFASASLVDIGNDH
jgi:hypothetical protein